MSTVSINDLQSTLNNLNFYDDNLQKYDVTLSDLFENILNLYQPETI